VTGSALSAMSRTRPRTWRSQAVKVATKPLLLSHTAVLGSRALGPTPLRGRQVSASYARAIAETGGSVGI